jgi:hypothetical protein
LELNRASLAEEIGSRADACTAQNGRILDKEIPARPGWEAAAEEVRERLLARAIAGIVSTPPYPNR